MDAGIVVDGGQSLSQDAPLVCLPNFVSHTGQGEVVDATRVKLQDEIITHVLQVCCGWAKDGSGGGLMGVCSVVAW